MEKFKRFLNVLPWIISIIAITAIVAAVRYNNIAEENYNKHKTEIDGTVAALQAEAEELQNKTETLQKKIVNLQDKADFYQEQLDSYSDKPNAWQGAIDGLSDQLKQIYTADQDALDAFAKDLFMKAANEIAKNDYSTFPEYSKSDGWWGELQPMEITVDGFKYEMRDREFYWLEEEYYDFFTDELLTKVLDKRFIIKEIDNRTYFYVKEANAGAKEWGVANAELARISEKGDEIKYSVKYDRVEQGAITDKGLTCTMTIKYEEGRYRISDTNFGNL